MAVFKELITAVAKLAADETIKGKGVLKDALSFAAAVTAGEAADEAAKKLNLFRTNRWGEQVLKIPFFKSTDDKILDAFAKHPEREKVCFHFENTYASLKKGVLFYDPDGNVLFSIPANKRNLKEIDLYQKGSFTGRISKHITFNLNLFSDLQKYDLVIRNRTGIVRVSRHNASIENASWTMSHGIGKDYIIEDKNGKEVARFYSLGFYNFVFDYKGSVDPAELILAFMAIQIRSQEKQANHRGDKTKLLGSFTGDIKDKF